MDDKSPKPPVESAMIDPVVVDAGKASKKKIKALKRGKGSLMRDISSIVEDVRADLGDVGADTKILPIVIVYQKKVRRSGLSGLF